MTEDHQDDLERLASVAVTLRAAGRGGRAAVLDELVLLAMETRSDAAPDDLSEKLEELVGRLDDLGGLYDEIFAALTLYAKAQRDAAALARSLTPEVIGGDVHGLVYQNELAVEADPRVALPMTTGERLAAVLLRFTLAAVDQIEDRDTLARVLNRRFAEAFDRKLAELIAAGGVFSPGLGRGVKVEALRAELAELRQGLDTDGGEHV